jgi:phosphate butyryltransferase
MITSFQELIDHLSSQRTTKRLVVVYPHDEHTMEAVFRALREGWVHLLLVGDREKMPLPADWEDYKDKIEFEHADSAAEAARLSVLAVRNGRANAMMKALINTDVLLRAVLNKEEGILKQGRVMSHVAVIEVPLLKRFLLMSDAAVLPYPTEVQRAAQITYLSEMCRKLQIQQPRIAMLHCTEFASEKFPHTMTYAPLIERAQAGEWGNILLDGPLDLRCAIDQEALEIKGIKSTLEGKADALLFPDIEGANAFYKTMPFFAQAEIAGVLQGTDCPVVLSSRGDSVLTKYYSIAVALC